jgi:hypothetical protein
MIERIDVFPVEFIKFRYVPKNMGKAPRRRNNSASPREEETERLNTTTTRPKQLSFQK